MKGGDDVPMQKLVRRSQDSATWTVKTCNLVEYTNRIQIRMSWIEKEKDQSSEARDQHSHKPLV